MAENQLDLEAVAIPLDWSDPHDPGVNAVLRATAGASLVNLGESVHGDGAAYEAKSEAARLLVARGGFTAMAWESGLVGMAALPELATPMERLLALFPTWWCDETLSLFQDFQDGDLRHEGIDLQLSSGPNDLTDWLESTLEGLGADPVVRGAFLRLLVAGRGETASGAAAADAALATGFLNEHVVQGRISNALAQLPSCWSWLEARPEGEPTDDNLHLWIPCAEERDAAMARNLIFAMRGTDPGTRWLCWAHTGHVMRAETDFTCLGQLVSPELGPRMYTLACVSYSGTYRLGNVTHELPPAPNGSVEAALHSLGHARAFLDLRSLPGDHPLREPVLSRLQVEPGSAARAHVLPDCVDGLIFTDQMRPPMREVFDSAHRALTAL